MSIEMRHTEKNLLFMLLMAETIDDYKQATSQLMAFMEPEDVEIVQKRVGEEKARRKS